MSINLSGSLSSVNNLVATLPSPVTIGTGDYTFAIQFNRTNHGAFIADIAYLTEAISGSIVVGMINWSDGVSLTGYFGNSFSTASSATTDGKWYSAVTSRASGVARFRLFDSSSTKIYDYTQNNTLNMTTLDTIVIGKLGYAEGPMEGEVTNLKIHTGVEWTDGQCVTEFSKFGIQTAGGTDRISFGLENTGSWSYGIVDYEGSGVTLTNTGTVNGLTRPAVLEAAIIHAGNVVNSYGPVPTLGSGPVPFIFYPA